MTASRDLNRESHLGPFLTQTQGDGMSSTQITPYLFFGGRCDEALEFYRKALR